MTKLRTSCLENHQPPANVPACRKIGTVAGYSAFGGFLDGGGYGEDQTAIDQISDWNVGYQTTFDELQDSANTIWAWLDATHEISNEDCPFCGYPHDDMATWTLERDDKVADLRYLDGEIDDEWNELADMCRALVSDTAYEAFLADQS